MLTAVLSAELQVAIELGSFLGVSSRAILNAAPHATLICVDHWRGSPEHLLTDAPPHWRRRIETLYEGFLRNLWPWRERVIPLRADTLEGLAEIAAAGVVPELVYVDSEHTCDRVSRELAFCTEHWPAATIVGDDYNQAEVARAVQRHAAASGRTVACNATAFCFPGQRTGQ